MLRVITFFTLLGAGFSASGQESTEALPAARALTLSEAVEQVLIHNESLQSKLLDAEIARRQYRAEKGIFEPAVVGSYEHIDSERENTVEQTRNLFGPFGGGSGTTLFTEKNDLYNGGLEFLSPVGSRFRVGYNLRRLENSLQGPTVNSEYVTTVGLTATQPLLKNFGTAATLARIRLAAINSDLAFQDYRRQLMLTVSRAEAAYWDLYFAQEQQRISQESVNLAQSLYDDNKTRLEVGRSSELEVLQAEAGLSLRRARRSEAGQRQTEAANQLSTMFSSAVVDAAEVDVVAVQEPELADVTIDYYSSYRNAFDNNPDYITRKQQALAEKVRLAFAKNQKLPQLDLKGSYGLNGLGGSPGHSWDDIESADFPAWSVGVELRIPITGGIRERNEYEAAKLAKQRALVGLKEIEVQIGNALNTAILKVRNLRESVENHRSVISFHEQLLENQLARLEVGVIDSRTVLETEEQLFEARMGLLDNLVQYQKALLELQLVQGTTLLDRNLDLSKPELQHLTQRMLAANRFAGPEFDNLKQEIEVEYQNRIRDLDATEQPQTFRQRIFQ